VIQSVQAAGEWSDAAEFCGGGWVSQAAEDDAPSTPAQGGIALDGKMPRGSSDKFHDRTAVQPLSAFATDTALVRAHVDIAEKSNDIPAAKTLLSELGIGPATPSSSARCTSKNSFRQFYIIQHRTDRPVQEQPFHPAATSPTNRRHHTAARAAEDIGAHWRIENTSHYRRDVTLSEGCSRISINPGIFSARAASPAISSMQIAPSRSAGTATVPLSQTSASRSNSSN
jgi:hypothetical protein